MNIKDELSNEGQKFWDKLGSQEFIEALSKPAVVTKRRPEKIKREELQKLLANSQKVVIDCKLLVAKYTKDENYFKANEAKTAGIIHNNFVNRLDRIIKGGNFDIGHVANSFFEDTTLPMT